jgi:hypothetical protein
MAHRILTSLVGIDATFSSTLSLTSLAGVGNRMLIVNSAGTVSTQAIPTGTVTSVGLSMPSAFTVTNSPVTGAGTLTVTGAGTAVQYIRGDGTLGVFPDVGGGGGGTVYYLNGNTSQGSIGGTTMYQLSKVPGTGAAANFTRSTTGTIASFITDVGSPNQLTVPPGIWVFNAYLSETGGGSSHAEILAVVEKWDGTTITVINTGPIEQIVNGNVKDLYQFGVSIPSGITLAASDRIAIQIQISNTNGKTVTLYTEDSNICSVTTTFSNGLASLNGLTAPTQYFAVGTSGTDFGISSSSATHTFNLPTASATNRGALSSSDWTTFNNKQNALTNPITGTGTANYLPKFTGSTALGNSLVYDDGTNIGIGTASPSYKLDVNGTARIVNTLTIFNSSLSGYNSGGTANDSLKVSSSNLGASFATQNTNASGYSGIEYIDNSGSVKVFTGFNNNNGQEFRFNNIATSGYIDFLISSTSALRVFNSRNIGIGVTTDAGYKLDVNGTQRVQYGTVERGAIFTHSNGTYAEIVLGNGSAAGTGIVEIHRNGTSAISLRSNSLFINTSRLATPSTFFVNGAFGGSSLGTSVRLSSNTIDQGVYTATSGTQSTVVIGNSGNEIWSPSSGNATYNLLSISPVINTSGTYAGTVRGLYINPTLTSVTGTSYNAIEATGGNVVFGSSSTASQLFVNGGYGGTTPLDIYLANFYGTSTINTGYGTGSKQWLLIGRGSIPTTSGIAGINLGNNQYESGLLFATASGGVFSEKMRIWNTGNVTINFTTDAGYKLDVNGTGRIQNNFEVGAGGSSLQGVKVIPGGYPSLQFWESVMRFSLDREGNNGLSFSSVNGFCAHMINTGTLIGGTSRYDLNSSAQLQVESTTRGFLPPRMTAAQRAAISTPATGLIVYQTDSVEGLYVYTSSGWKALTMV